MILVCSQTEMRTVLLETERKINNPCYKVAKNLVKLSSSVLWRAEILSDTLVCLFLSKILMAQPPFSFLCLGKYERKEII